MDGKTPVATIAQGQEITERKKAEEALKESEQRLNIVLNSILTGVVIVDAETHEIIDANPLAAKLIGLPKEEIIGRVCNKFICPAEEGKCPISDLGQTVDQSERVLIRGDGKEIPILKTVTPASWQGRSYFVESFVDITERKKAEQTLRESEERYKSLFKANIDGILIADPTTKKFRYANPAMCRMLGYSEEELTQMGVADIHPKDSLEQVSAEFEALASGAKITAKDLLCVRKDGQVISVSINAGKVMIDQTKYLLAIFRDITERQQAEQHQAQLLEQLEKTNKELNDFAYITSHDLKAPLRGIATLANWISTDYADKLDDNGKEQMNLLASRVDRMHNLIDGILQYSRVGRVEEEKVVVNLNELVTEAIDMIAPPENVTITIENELPTIECEQTRIMQVFQNLLSNAVKYMDKPQGQIKVGCVEEDGFWEFYVADNGPGIEEKYFEKIFQLFQTLAPRDESESTGIGLTIIKKIVEMYGGKTWVQSKVGSGSTFFFTLPKALSVTNNEKQLLTSSR